MQPAKPSFLEYFEQKEKEANVQNDGGGNHADNRKLPADGDLQVVSETSRPSPRWRCNTRRRHADYFSSLLAVRAANVLTNKLLRSASTFPPRLHVYLRD